MPIVALGDAAEEAAALLAKGDSFTAEGRIRPVRYEKEGKSIESEEFEVWKIGRRLNDAERSGHAERALAAEVCAAASEGARDLPPEFTSPRASARSASSLAL